MSIEVHVRVDQPGQDGESPQVIGSRRGAAAFHARDLPVADDDRGVGNDAASPVESRGAADDRGLVLGGRDGRQRGPAKRERRFPFIMVAARILTWGGPMSKTQSQGVQRRRDRAIPVTIMIWAEDD
jgi:hypothetical protein